MNAQPCATSPQTVTHPQDSPQPTRSSQANSFTPLPTGTQDDSHMPRAPGAECFLLALLAGYHHHLQGLQAQVSRLTTAMESAGMQIPPSTPGPNPSRSPAQPSPPGPSHTRHSPPPSDPIQFGTLPPFFPPTEVGTASPSCPSTSSAQPRSPLIYQQPRPTTKQPPFPPAEVSSANSPGPSSAQPHCPLPQRQQKRTMPQQSSHQRHSATIGQGDIPGVVGGRFSPLLDTNIEPDLPMPRSSPPSRTPTQSHPFGPRSYKEPFNKRAFVMGLPWDNDNTTLQDNISLLANTIIYSANLSTDAVLSVKPVGQPRLSRFVPDEVVTCAVVEFSTPQAQQAALTSQSVLNDGGIYLQEAIPRQMQGLRRYRLYQLSKLPNVGMEAAVFGTDFFYKPPSHLPPPPDHFPRRGQWVWAPGYSFLQGVIADILGEYNRTAFAPTEAPGPSKSGAPTPSVPSSPQVPRPSNAGSQKEASQARPSGNQYRSGGRSKHGVFNNRDQRGGFHPRGSRPVRHPQQGAPGPSTRASPLNPAPSTPQRGDPGAPGPSRRGARHSDSQGGNVGGARAPRSQGGSDRDTS